MASTSEESRPNKAFALLTAIVAGDAKIEDGVAELESEGIESLESALSILRDGLRERERAGAARLVNLQRSRGTSTPERTARIVQRVPSIPFILNGTMYDPEDIIRFNGQELHFVPAPSADHMLVLDDRELIENWWQLAYLEQYRQGGNQSSASEPSPARAPRTYFYEDINFVGSQIYLDANRGYYDLTQVSLRWPSGNDWNDKISSFRMYGPTVTVLHDDIRWTGQTLTIQVPYGTSYHEEGNLLNLGWNDRASSLETW